jgi:hypothetical protein
MKTKYSFFRVLSFLLLPFLFFAAPEYFECKDLDPDEGLDHFVILQDSVASATLREGRPSICRISNFFSKTDSIQYHQSWDIYPEPFTSELILSVTLRC